MTDHDGWHRGQLQNDEKYRLCYCLIVIGGLIEKVRKGNRLSRTRFGKIFGLTAEQVKLLEEDTFDAMPDELEAVLGGLLLVVNSPEPKLDTMSNLTILRKKAKIAER